MSTYPAVVTIMNLTTATTLSTTAFFEATQTTNGQLESIKASVAQIAAVVGSSVSGLPSGGGTGQLLNKLSGADSSAGWTDIASAVVASTGIAISGSTVAMVAFSTATPLSILGVAGTATAVPLPIAGIGAQVLRLNDAGTAVAFGAVNLASSAAVTGALNTANAGFPPSGGTGQILTKLSGADFATAWTALVSALLVASTGISIAGSTTATVALATTTPLSVLGVAGTATTNPLPIVGTGAQVLRLNDAGTAVAFGPVNLGTTAAVTGVLTVPFGGTGTSTLTAFGAVYGNGSSTLGITAAGTTNWALLGAGTAVAPSFAQVNLTLSVTGTLTVPFGGIGFTALATGDLLYATNATTLARQAISTATQVLQVASGATTLRYGAVNLTTAVTGVLTVPFGGIGTAALTAFAVIVGGINATAPLQAIASTAATGSILTSNGPGVLPSFQAAGAGSGDVVGPSSATDLALAAFTGTTGKAIQNTSVTISSTGPSGILAVGGVNLTPNIPQTSQAAAYTAVLADANTQLLHPLADGNARTFTIPANASVVYPIGTCLTFVNETATLTIAINSDTLTVAGTGSTGSRTLAANGMVTAVKITSTKWMISGAGLA